MPVSTCFLFMLVFFTCKLVLNKVFSRSISLEPQGSMGMTIPGKALLSINSQMSWNEYIQNLVASTITSFYSLYGLYKCLKKYSNCKYVVSITRNASRFAGFICNLYVPVCIRDFFYGGFAYVYQIDMAEYEFPDFKHYNTFTEFFIRRLKHGARKISEPNNT